MASPPKPAPPVTLTSEAGNGAIFGTLCAVLLMTIGFSFVKEKAKVTYDKNSYLAARDSQGLISMTLSYFVSGMGAWVIFAAPQAAVIGGSVALVGYALSTAFPLLLFGLMAPLMRKNVPNGFTIIDYVYGRFGPINAIYVGITSLLYMTIYLTAELTSAGTLATGLANIPTLENTFWEGDNVFTPMPLSPILGVSLITLAYTALGGLPVSILTDRIQGAGIFLLTIIIAIAAYAYADGWDASRFSEAAGHGVHPNYVPTDYGNSFAVAISLVLGVTCANLFNAGYWQRVWAAESNNTVKHATYLSSLLSLVVMTLMGITGWIAYGHYGSNIIIPKIFDITFLSAPYLVRGFMGDGWAVLVLIFGTAMIASTADTLQSGMTALLWPAADKLFPNMKQSYKLVLIVAVMCLINVPAIILALSGQSILQLFLLADLLCASAVAPVLLGFWDRTHPAASFIGMLAGIATLLVTYAVADVWGEGYDQLVNIQGGIFNRSATYAFCLTPVVSALVTVAISLMIPGYKFAGFQQSPGSSTSNDVQLSNAREAEAQGVSSC